jgi:hypothetical protein
MKTTQHALFASLLVLSLAARAPTQRKTHTPASIWAKRK